MTSPDFHDPEARKRAVAQLAHALRGHLAFQAELGATGVPIAEPQEREALEANIQRRELERQRRDFEALSAPRRPAPTPAPARPPQTSAPQAARAPDASPVVQAGDAATAISERLLSAVADADKAAPTTTTDNPYKLTGMIAAPRRNRGAAPTPPAPPAPAAAAPAPKPTQAAPTPPPPPPAPPEPRPVARTAAERLQVLRTQAEGCDHCGLCKSRQRVVFGEGNPNAALVFIGEAPGAEDEARGVPFSSPAGELLDRMIVAMRLKREDVYLCQLVQCRPPGDRPPSADEIARCASFLEQQLALVKPRVIVTLGPLAARALLGVDPPLGAWCDWKGTAVMPTVHPAAILADNRHKRPAWEALQNVMNRLQKRS